MNIENPLGLPTEKLPEKPPEAVLEERLTEQLLVHEALKTKMYKCTAGKWTIGVGRNLEDRGVTRDEALYLLSNDIKVSIQDLTKVLPDWRKLSEDRQVALLDMMFNLGYPTFLLFKNMIAAVKAGSFDIAADEMLDSKWARQVGRRAIKLSNLMRGNNGN